jgi:hypothetical protein
MNDNPGMKILLNAVQPTAPRIQEGTKTTPTSTRARNRPRHPRPHLTYCRNLDDQTRRPLLQPPRLKRKKGSALHLSGGSGGVRNANRGMWGILSRSFENADQATRTTRVRNCKARPLPSIFGGVVGRLQVVARRIVVRESGWFPRSIEHGLLP